MKKGQTRFDDLDENIISLYARGLTQREIQGHLEEIYGVEVSPSLISTVTDAVLDEVRAWQSRPLDAVYLILYLDALQVKVKSQGRVTNKAIYLAFGVNLQGLKEVSGMWASETEGAKFWMRIITELKNRSLFPSDEAVFKLLFLALKNISRRWTMPIRNWSGAMNQFAILFDGRVPMGDHVPSCSPASRNFNCNKHCFRTPRVCA